MRFAQNNCIKKYLLFYGQLQNQNKHFGQPISSKTEYNCYSFVDLVIDGFFIARVIYESE